MVKPRARPRIMTATDRVDRALREPGERGRLEREFEVHGELGKGGMGTVLAARDLRLCRSVAVKVLAPALRFDQLATQRFVLEAQVVAQLEHPNIVPIYGLACDESGKPGFAMRLVEGESFREYLDACGASAKASETEPHDLDSRIERFLKACDAIEYAHARGVVHRDLKPENIMLGEHNEVYVVDWGLAKVTTPDEATAEAASGLTAAGLAVGTPGYMAPEQAQSGHSAGPASDQYALGLILQELATLRRARMAEGRGRALRAAVKNARAPFAPRYGSALPRALEAIVSKATATVPEERYPSVAEFARDVRRFVRGEEVHAHPDTLAAKLWRRLRRRPEVVFGVVLGLLAVTSTVVVIALVRELGARERADKQSSRMASLAGQVARTASTIDARAALADLVLEGLAAGASEAIDQPPRFPDHHLTPSDLAQDDRPVYIGRYHQRVTFEHMVTLIPPWATGSEAAVARSGDFERLLLRSAVRGTDDGSALERPAAEQSAIARERSPLLWSSLGFESGVMMSFPGNTFFPVDYDPRKRSWYVAAVEKGKRGHVWGSPYPDATSGALIVPCSTALYDHAERLRGVAVVSLELDELLAQIAREDLEGFRASAVLDEKGDVVFWTGERGRILGAGVHENRTLERRPFGLTAVRSGVAGGARNGMVHAGDALVVYQRLTAFPWTLAVTLAAAPYAR